MKKIALLTLASLLLLTSLFAKKFTADSKHGNVGFFATHFFVAKVSGNFKSFNGELTTDAAGKIKSISGTIDVDSIDTRIEKRDKDLKSKRFFDAKNHPKITFKSKSYKGSVNKGKLTADITMKGVTKEIILSVETTAVVDGMQGSKVKGLSLKGKILRDDFKLGDGLAYKIVGEEVELDVSLEFIQQK